jgi:DNA-directed RNA polymerase specialized sigma24 family protein
VATVAEVMGVPEGTVKSTTARALDALRTELARRGLLIDVRGDE